MIYLIKAFARWLRFYRRVGVTYHEYTKEQIESANYNHPLGWYEADGKRLAFRDVDGSTQFRW